MRDNPRPARNLPRRAHSRARSHHFRGIHGSMSLPSRNTATTPAPTIAALATITPAWTSARFSAVCWRANFRKCGLSSAGPRNSRWWNLALARRTFASQILNFAAASFPKFYSALRYIAIERSAARRAAAAAASSLARHVAARHFAMASELPARIPCGCVFSNEFFDALPVHRLVREGNGMREFYVGDGHARPV